MNGCNREEEDPAETHMPLAVSSHFSLSAIFSPPCLHSDFMTHFASVGRNDAVPLTLCFS